jgi:hypothetical protein
MEMVCRERKNMLKALLGILDWVMYMLLCGPVRNNCA